MRKTKDYFFFCLRENVIVFDVFDYIEEIAADCVDFLYEWNLIKNNLVFCRKKILKEFIEKRIDADISSIKQKTNQANCKILCFFSKKSKLNQWSKFFDVPDSFIRMAKKIAKQKLPNYVEITSENSLFQKMKGSFNNIPCILPTGEDEEFLIKIQKKLTHTYLTKKIHTVK
jgi:hypothetical protein